MYFKLKFSYHISTDFYFLLFRHFSQQRKVIPKVQNLSFSFINQSCIQLCYHKNGIKLVSGFYWSLYISLKNNKTVFQGIYLKNYTCRDFLLNVINFKCTNFTMEALIVLPVCNTSIFVNVTVIYDVNTPFYSFSDKKYSYVKAEFLKVTLESSMSSFIITNSWIYCLLIVSWLICWHFIKSTIDFIFLKQCLYFPFLYHNLSAFCLS